LSKISPNLRYVNNNKDIKTIQTIAFCAGSGSEFIKEAQEMGAEALVTGDLKFHTALDSEIVIFDIGHFESEILVLPVLEKLIGSGVEIVYAKENSPFLYD
jgi:putative NIF3 family GTP cyclohydrolase 1 type 2